MDKSLIEKYKQEMLKMQKSAKTVPANAPLTEDIASYSENNSSSGGLIAVVTTLRTLYPVEGARVTIFTGDLNDMQVLATDSTDQSGKSKLFTLPTPEKSLSTSAGAEQKPYATYNMLVTAEGYLDNVHLNIPVFSGVTSLQRSNLLLLETAGVNKGPQIFDEAQQYQL